MATVDIEIESRESDKFKLVWGDSMTNRIWLYEKEKRRFSRFMAEVTG